MTSSDEADARVPDVPAARFVLEYVDPTILGISPANPTATETMEFCRGVLSLLALKPESVTLVVSGEFIESVKSRLPDGLYRDSYDLERGAGSVAAKTMRVGDEIHVIMPAWLFLDSDAAGEKLSAEDAQELISSEDDRARLARRTAVHEAHHVAMYQAGEDDTDFSGEGWARQSFLNVAHQVIAEYRAELGVPRTLREGYETVFPLSSLEVLRSDLHRIAAVEYQQHLDVGRLSYEVGQETHHMWKALAYLTAARRVASIPIGTGFPDDVTNSEVWHLMAQDHWADFERLLSPIPSGGNRVDAADLQRWTTELADLLDRWLTGLGFTWTDKHDGGSEFRIQSWELIL